MALRRVKVDGGLLEGVPGSNPNITVFKGIPYAAPPVGDLRWRPPQPVIPWEGVRIADTFGPMAMQPRQVKGSFSQREFYPEELPMSEDCLYLNIWTPAESENDKLPVIFWIHGGVLRHGYGHKLETDGEGFAKRGVILVTINYRLGALGFLAHPALSKESERKVSGNYGILDQIAALKWVKNNIAAFGGDPENITIAGQSAGAMSVQTLVASPLAWGFINKAILQSGGGVHAFGSLPTLEEAEEMGLQIASVFNASTAEELRSIPAEAIIEKTTDFIVLGNERKPVRYTPNIDAYVLYEDPSDAIMHGNVQNIPYLMGSTADEMRTVKITYNEFMARAKAQYGKYAEKYLELSNVTNDEEAAADNTFADRMIAATRVWAEVFDELKKSPVYLYYFTRKLPGDDSGAFHSGELWYVFETLPRSWRPFEKIDYELADKIAGYWANFAMKGDPNGEGLPQWTPYTKESPLTMELGTTVGMFRMEETPRVKFFKDLCTGKLK